MPCEDCLSNCNGLRTTDKCVEYTGADIACLGICTGDSLFEVEAAIADKLCSILDGTNIDLSDVNVTCSFLTGILANADPTLANLMQMLVTASCTLRELIQDIQDDLNVVISIDAPCLTLPSNPTIIDVAVAAAEKVCDVSDIADAIQADYVKASELCTLVNQCIAGSASTQEYAKMPKYVPMAYLGPLSVFDSSGKGLAAYGYDKVYICNGNNGTQDLRGRALVGANTNVVGPALDAAVDPSLPANVGYSITQNTKKGAYTDTLTTTTMPSHTHTVTDPGHTHPYIGVDTVITAGGTNSTRRCGDFSKTTSSAATGISIASTGSSQPHNNMQSSFGVVWIIYLP